MSDTIDGRAETLLTVQEVADRLRTRPETVRRWISVDKLKATMPGGRRMGYRIKESDLEHMLREAEA